MLKRLKSLFLTLWSRLAALFTGRRAAVMQGQLEHFAAELGDARSRIKRLEALSVQYSEQIASLRGLLTPTKAPPNTPAADSQAWRRLFSASG